MQGSPHGRHGISAKALLTLPSSPPRSFLPMEILKPWLPHGGELRDPSLIVMHSTAGASAASTVSWIRQEARRGRKLSYHYLIERDSSILKCVPTRNVAFHAGVSVGPGGPGCNLYSIGVAFAHLNDSREEITARQIAAAETLARDLKSAIPSLQYVCTHHGIAPDRKTDPRGFEVQEFAASVGLTPWKLALARWKT